MSGDWIRVADALEIEIGGAAVARYEGHQIAVFRLGESDFRAVDNLCPHEGYPLVLSEHQALGDDPQAVVPLLAALRLLDSPLRERQVRRNSEEAVRFIGAGKPPRRLTTAP